MSDFPGEMTKQSFVEPALSMRSTTCSLMARGRSVMPSNRLPTGSSSFENASGWMRVPAPAAGMMPHIIGSGGSDGRGGARGGRRLRGAFGGSPARGERAFKRHFELEDAMEGGVLVEDALAR